MDEPLEVYAHDFDNNVSFESVLGYYEKGNLYPFHGKNRLSTQLPFITAKFPTYDAFGNATLKDIFGQQKLEEALHIEATHFANSYFENDGEGNFTIHSLGNRAQFSSVNDIAVDDFDGDSHLDILIAGNLFNTEVETPRNDASYGLFLKGDGQGDFEPVSSINSGLHIEGEVKSIKKLKLADNRPALLIAKKQGPLQIISWN